MRITLDTTPCHFGGVSLWFKCPRCFKRVGILYAYTNPLGYYCKYCLDLTYRDRQEKGTMFFEIGRLIRKIRKIKAKMNKKGIRFKTFLKLNEQLKPLVKQVKILDELGAKLLLQKHNKWREKTGRKPWKRKPNK